MLAREQILHIKSNASDPNTFIVIFYSSHIAMIFDEKKKQPEYGALVRVRKCIFAILTRQVESACNVLERGRLAIKAVV